LVAGIKVSAIVVSLILGDVRTRPLAAQYMDFSNLTAHGGFLPHGPMGTTAAIVTAIF